MNLEDYITAIEVAAATAARGVPLTFTDILALVHVYSATKASGKLGLAAMAKAGTLKANVKAARNAFDTLDDLLSDNETDAKVEGLLASMDL